MRPENGEPVQYKIGDSYWLGCCDCGLTHLAFFRIKNKKTIEEVVYRDDYCTKIKRYKMSEKDIKWLINEFRKELRRRKKNARVESE